MKASEIRELTDDELERKLAESRQELFNLRFQHATGALDNTAALRARQARHRPPADDRPRAARAPEEQAS